MLNKKCLFRGPRVVLLDYVKRDHGKRVNLSQSDVTSKTPILCPELTLNNRMASSKLPHLLRHPLSSSVIVL